MIDEAMLAIEKANPEQLKGVLPKDYGRPALDTVMLGELIDLISDIGMGDTDDKARDVLGRVYEYFLGGFAGAEGKRGGEFYTPSSVVRTLVSMLEPYKGRSMTPAVGLAACSCSPNALWKPMVASWVILPFMGRRATTPLGVWPV